MKKNRIEVQHFNNVPAYGLLYHDQYKWVGGYLKMLDTKKRIRELESEKKSVAFLLPSKADFMRRLKKNYDELVNQQAANLLKFLIDQYQNLNPVSSLRQQLSSGDCRAPFLIPSWQILQSTAEKMDVQGQTIEEKERIERVTGIDKSLEKLHMKVDALTPDEFCLRFDNGHLEEDFRETFVKFWKSLQLKVTRPISPLGVELSKSVEAEQKAWNQLGLSRRVSDLAPFLPYPGDGLLPNQLIPKIPTKKPSRLMKPLKRILAAR